MSQVIGQLRRAPPPTAAAPNDGDYSSIDLLRTAGARAQSTGEEAASPAGQPQNVYGPLLMQAQDIQETDPTYSEIATYDDVIRQ